MATLKRNPYEPKTTKLYAMWLVIDGKQVERRFESSMPYPDSGRGPYFLVNGRHYEAKADRMRDAAAALKLEVAPEPERPKITRPAMAPRKK